MNFITNNGIHHAIIANIIQLILFFFGINLWIGAGVMLGFYIGRELAQAEYRWISAFGNGKRDNMPLWAGFDIAVWNKKSLLDAVSPTITVLLVATIWQVWSY